MVTLWYPKKLFNKKEVDAERKIMQYPEMWKLESNKKEYKLKFKRS